LKTTFEASPLPVVFASAGAAPTSAGAAGAGGGAAGGSGSIGVGSTGGAPDGRVSADTVALASAPQMGAANKIDQRERIIPAAYHEVKRAGTSRPPRRGDRAVGAARSSSPAI
jgi:hypothetical protein